MREEKEMRPDTAADDFRKLAIGAGVFLGSLILLIILLIGCILNSSSGAAGGERAGLMSGTPLDAPDAVTVEDLEAQYEARAPMTIHTQDMFLMDISNYLDSGDFSGLDRYLAEQQALYKTVDGDDMQTMNEWRGMFETYRGDVAKTVNLSAGNAAQAFSSYYHPDVLAAAIAYSPVSVKKDFFIDWSAALLPAEQRGTSIHLSEIHFESASEELAAIKQTSGDRYIDVKAYNLTLHDYEFRLVIVQNEYGFYLPYSLKNTDGFMPNPLTRLDLLPLEEMKDAYVDLDALISVPRLDRVWAAALKEGYPEYFNDGGVYIGGLEAAQSSGTLPVEVPAAPHTAAQE